MEYLKIESDFPQLKASAVALGKFDGIHRGHRMLLDEITARKEDGLGAVMVAIDVNETMICSRAERMHFVENLGVDVFVETSLSDDLRTMKAEDFVKKILISDLDVRFLSVGDDYRFGYERRGDVDLLLRMGKKYGFEVLVVPRLTDGKRRISSTYIREELQKGKMEKVTELMGRSYFAEGCIAHGRGLGHKYLLPTINILPDPEKLMPPAGVYFTTTEMEEGTWNGISNIGSNPTVGGNEVRIETYLFDCDRDLYDKPCLIHFHHYERPERKFSSLEELRGQLLTDAGKGKEYFEKNGQILRAEEGPDEGRLRWR